MASRKPHPVEVTIGRQLELGRKNLGMTQTDLAKIGGITFQQVQKYEKGTNSITARRLYEFAMALQVPIESFFEEREKAEAKRQNVSTKAIHLVQSFTSIRSAAVHKAISAIVREIAKRGG